MKIPRDNAHTGMLNTPRLCSHPEPTSAILLIAGNEDSKRQCSHRHARHKVSVTCTHLRHPADRFKLQRGLQDTALTPACSAQHVSVVILNPPLPYCSQQEMKTPRGNAHTGMLNTSCQCGHPEPTPLPYCSQQGMRRIQDNAHTGMLNTLNPCSHPEPTSAILLTDSNCGVDSRTQRSHPHWNP